MTNELLKRLLVWSQSSPRFAGRTDYVDWSAKANESGTSFPQATTEYADQAAFLENFRGSGVDVLREITGKTILDFGSGYGGRTAWFAEYAGVAYGIEPSQAVVQMSAAFARTRGADNCHFRVGSETTIDFPDDYFDVVLSYDVLEHVQRPDAILPEMRRVLKSSGKLLLVFTPYYGMFAHHLNYITLLPALHWFFSPRALITAINELIESHPKIRPLGLQPQPAPTLAYDHTREVLPTVNGLTKGKYLRIMAQLGFELVYLRSTPILEKFAVAGAPGAAVNRWLCAIPGLDEALAHNLVSIYRKP